MDPHKERVAAYGFPRCRVFNSPHPVRGTEVYTIRYDTQRPPEGGRLRLPLYSPARP